jgi:hypothetical protein
MSDRRRIFGVIVGLEIWPEARRPLRATLFRLHPALREEGFGVEEICPEVLGVEGFHYRA